MPVRANSLLWMLAGLLIFANLVAWQWPRASRPVPSAELAAWQRWFARAPQERLALLRSYQAIRERPNAQAILRHAQEFVSLPRIEREALRAVRGAWQQVLERESPARRRELLRVPARAAAYFAHRSLADKQPERLAELTGMLREAGRRSIGPGDVGPSAPE